jgi:hypothetical protein
MDIDIDVILENIKDNKSERTKNNLDTLNGILKAYAESGNRDFSITQIGRVSAENGGIAYEAIRATRNNHYRELIEAWAQKCNTNIKKPLLPTSRSRTIPTDNKLLERIPDPAVRALFGQVIAERNRYRNEVNLLKQHTNIIIDKRPVSHVETRHEINDKESPFLSGILTKSEMNALVYAISDECMENNGWQYTQAGQVKAVEYNLEIFPRGFVTGLRKILDKIHFN